MDNTVTSQHNCKVLKPYSLHFNDNNLKMEGVYFIVFSGQVFKTETRLYTNQISENLTHR
jgi:hypothetical protein